MNTFEEYQALAVKVPLALRNNRDRIELPISQLQTEAGKIGLLLAAASASGKLSLTAAQRSELQDRLADILWCVTLLGNETGMTLQDVASHSFQELQMRMEKLDPEQR